MFIINKNLVFEFGQYFYNLFVYFYLKFHTSTMNFCFNVLMFQFFLSFRNMFIYYSNELCQETPVLDMGCKGKIFFICLVLVKKRLFVVLFPKAFKPVKRFISSLKLIAVSVKGLFTNYVSGQKGWWRFAKYWQWLTKGGGRVRQMLTMADKGGRGFWLLMISLIKLLKKTNHIGFS